MRQRGCRVLGVGCRVSSEAPDSEFRPYLHDIAGVHVVLQDLLVALARHQDVLLVVVRVDFHRVPGTYSRSLLSST